MGKQRRVTIAPSDRRMLAVEMGIHPETLRRALSGRRTMPLVEKEIRRVLEAHGLSDALPAGKGDGTR